MKNQRDNKKIDIDELEPAMCPCCERKFLLDPDKPTAICKKCKTSFEADAATETYKRHLEVEADEIRASQTGFRKRAKGKREVIEFYERESIAIEKLRKKEKIKQLIRRYWALLLVGAFLLITVCAIAGDYDSASEDSSEVSDKIVEADGPSVIEPSEVILPEQTQSLPAEDSTFEIYFLDVDQGDAAVVLCDGKAMLIDGGNSKQSSRIYSFLSTHNITHLDYIVASHPDADHVGGLSGALNYATVDTALCTTDTYETETFSDFVKYLKAQDVMITIPDAGDTYRLGSASITIVGPKKNVAYSDNTSLVLRIEYFDTSFLFTGDAEIEDEQAAIASGYDIKSNVLKVAHHGSNSSSSYHFIYEVDPDYAVISVGGKNNYGHPTENVLSRLHDADVKTFRTDIQGDIHCRSDGTTITFDVKKNADIDVFTPSGGYANWIASKSTPTPAPSQPQSNPDRDAGASAATTYVVNLNTGKFHYSWCSSVGQMNESNKGYVSGTHDDLVGMGYSPCGRCHP